MAVQSRMIAMLTAGALVALTAAGCTGTSTGSNTAGGSTSGNEQNKEVKTVSILMNGDWGKMPGPDDKQIKYVTEKTGIAIKSETLPWNGGTDFTKGLNVKIAANELPDLFLPYGVEDTLLKQGALLALDDLLPKYAPTLWKSIPEDIWNSVRANSPDGKIYFIPRVNLYPRYSSLIRKDWLDKVNMKIPTTKDEYVAVLKAFRDQDPNGNGKADEIPTSGRELGRWMDHLFLMHGVAMVEGYPAWDLYNNELTYSAVTPNMKEAIKFASELYKEKLLDNETFLNKDATWKAKIQQDRVGSWIHLPEGLDQNFFQNLSKVNPNANIAGMAVPKVEGFKGFTPMPRFNGLEWAIPKSSKNSVEAMKLLEFYANPENRDFATFGIEGEHYEVKDGKKKRLPVSPDQTYLLNLYPVTTTEQITKTIKDQYDPKVAQMMIDAMMIAEKDGKTIAGDGIPVSIYDGFPDIKSHKLYQEYTSKIIIGDWPIEKFDEFVQKWKNSGGDEATKRAREWYAKMKK
ncbi:extracellular solute-binding protein [Paenibacillus sp. WQ 127069]|uniref:Extracellular solute-binding protein n=1 Tax=Paenibacillus baimaensis TaxID=2982185 RepID=A0ABT2UB47_9BACL|nr:extracellular solute-binding protein [Paenibacillus sp. WQ 127069]MCU6791868.1 extracellular solute-binding protein [Paenibacillus sp. WQ 127069]